MERFFRNVKTFAVVLAILLIVITSVMAVLSFFMKDELALDAANGMSQISSVPVMTPVAPEPASSDSQASSNHDDTSDSGPSGLAGDESTSGTVDGESEQVSSALGKNQATDASRMPLPQDMKAVYIMPGKDFSVSGTGEDIRGSIDNALTSVANLSMNAVVLSLDAQGIPIYQTEAVRSDVEIDILEYFIEKAHEMNLIVLARYEASLISTDGASLAIPNQLSVSVLDFAVENIKELVVKYKIDSLLLDTYYNKEQPGSYADYISSGTAMGYREHMRTMSETLIHGIEQAVHNVSDNLQIGIIVDGVWANAADTDGGSQTAAAFTSLHTGHSDTKKYIENHWVDYVAVRPNGAMGSAVEPYREVVRWWADVSSQADIPLYVLHASDKICTEASGYSSPDEIVQQIISARDYKAFKGSIFNSLSRLKENPEMSTDLLIKLYHNEVNVEHILTQLAVTKPDQSEFSTFEPVMVFRGASDPNFDVTLNDSVLETDENGYFTVTQDLQAGLNTFTFEHKGKTQTFRITRNVQIIKEVYPTGNVELEGGMQLQITALAYRDAAVAASINGQTVAMIRDTAIDDDTNEDSSYAKFIGTYTVPQAQGQKLPLGVITVTGSWEGTTDSMQGAQVTVNPAIAAGDGDLIVVTADSAKTFPTSVLNNESDPGYFPLPKGTKDYTVGEAQTFKNDSGTYQYYKLQSGVRVYADDITKTTGELSLGNTINSMEITSDKRFTYVKLDTGQPIPYLVQYRADGISFDFKYTASTPESKSVSGNPVISAANWSGSTLTLEFTKKGCFMGYYAYYDGTQLVLRLKNPPASISGVRVAVDPGHGGKDKGAPGYYPDVNESDINLAIAEKTTAALNRMGATAKMIQTDPYLTLTQRIEAARAFDADIYISIHANTSVNAQAAGTEVYYFYPNGQVLASTASQKVSDALDTQNRGGKQARYVVTTDSRFTSILIECGFISNKTEYKKLVDSGYQSQVAKAVANAVNAYVGYVSTGIAGGSDTQEEPQSGEEPVSKVSFAEDALTMKQGDEKQLEIQFKPEGSSNENVSWESDDEDVATVSKSGKVKAVSTGTAKITATTSDGKLSAECTIEVEEQPSGSQGDSLTGIGLDTDQVELRVDEEHQIKIHTEPSGFDAADLEVRFISEDESIAKVDKDGLVTAVSPGSVAILVETRGEWDCYAKLKITVDE